MTVRSIVTYYIIYVHVNPQQLVAMRNNYDKCHNYETLYI
jgi:hypothetical protein